MAVDDEELALRRLELAFEGFADAVLVAKAYSGRQAVELLPAVQPDVLLLDVEMATIGGIELANQLRGPAAPLIIFVTAFEQYAIDAFHLRAVDYVLKPVDFARLATALENARRMLRLSQAEREAAELSKTLATLQSRDGDGAARSRYLWAERFGEVARIPVEEIEYLESERDYVRVHVAEKSYLMRGPLADIQQNLDPAAFARVRRSAVVRVACIRGVREKGYADRRLILTSGREVRIGKTYLADVARLLARA
jgi:DNA-binding LytR/AlgR family response regulator